MAEGNVATDWTPPPRGGRWSEAVGRGMVESFRTGGESQASFGRRHGINSQRVKYWLDRIAIGGRRVEAKPVRRARSAASVTFAPVVIAEGPRAVMAQETAPSLDVVLGAAVVRVPAGFDEAHLRRVVAALGGASC